MEKTEGQPTSDEQLDSLLERYGSANYVASKTFGEGAEQAEADRQAAWNNLVSFTAEGLVQRKTPEDRRDLFASITNKASDRLRMTFSSPIEATFTKDTLMRVLEITSPKSPEE